MFTINCAACENHLNLPDEVAGKAIRCLRCKAFILVPDHPEENSNYSTGDDLTDSDDEVVREPIRAHPG